MNEEFNSLAEFYPYYLQEHQEGGCRASHLVGSFTVLLLLGWILSTGNFGMIWVCLLAGYGPAWFGHMVFEKNRPATFKHPLYSFASDWWMMKDIVTGRIPLLGKLPAHFFERPKNKRA